jgi:hypothetical protein
MSKHALVIAAVVALIPTLGHAEINARKAPTPSSARAPIPKVIVTEPSVPLSIDSMLAKINSVYMRGLRRCYEKGLAHDAGLTGKITLTFTVSPYGFVYGEAEGIAPGVDSCVATQLRSWKFQTTARRESSFRISLVLTQ